MDEDRRTNGAELLESVCDRERVAIIFNPVSGTEDGATRRARLEELALAVGLTCGVSDTDQDSGAGPLAREAVADNMERVLVSGGDGTVKEAADALVGTPTALAVLPAGTGNLLALNLGLPSDTEAAVRLALTGEARPMDVGRANGDVFLIMAGMGLDARMVRDADREQKNRLGVLAYIVSAWRNLGRPHVRFRITLDGQQIRRRAQTVLVANLGRIIGGLELVPGADPEDGLLDVAIVRARTPSELAAVAWRALRGERRSDPLLEIHRGREIMIEAESPQPIELDGNDLEPVARLEVRVEPRALRLVRAPVAEAAGAPFASPPVAAVTRRAVDLAVPLLAGAATTTLLHLRGSRRSSRGDHPGLLMRHPLLTGIAAGMALYLVRRLLVDNLPEDSE